jgi:DNA-binding Lrp family transcriptional regulator
MPATELDAIDVKILEALQEEGRLTNAELAERIALSPSPCWRRLKRLETQGVIKGYQAVLDRRRLGLGVTAFVSILLDNHSEKNARAFEAGVAAIPEIISCHNVSGHFDFLLQVVGEDLDRFSNLVLNRIRTLPGVKEMNTSFSLREVKSTNSLPIPGGVRKRGS